MTHPHLHLGGAVASHHQRLSNAHLPTGLVALHDVIILLIAELGVRPRRSDWAETLYAAAQG